MNQVRSFVGFSNSINTEGPKPGRGNATTEKDGTQTEKHTGRQRHQDTAKSRTRHAYKQAASYLCLPCYDAPGLSALFVALVVASALAVIVAI